MHPQILNLEAIRGDSDTDTALLRGMAIDAEHYLRSQPWCLDIKEGVYTEGIGGVVALFLFRVDINKLGTNRWIWIFAGDVPLAYMEFQDFPTPYKALEKYIYGLEEWVSAVGSKRPLDGLIPIEGLRDEETLASLTSRIETLKHHILPNISNTSTVH